MLSKKRMSRVVEHVVLERLLFKSAPNHIVLLPVPEVKTALIW